jgi:hypothetical protein
MFHNSKVMTIKVKPAIGDNNNLQQEFTQIPPEFSKEKCIYLDCL